jgi:membrane protein implicated in regulation of membrane protease activity
MIEYFSSHLPFFWLTIGISFILLETLLVPGIGFLFVGLGSLSLGGLIAFRIIDTSNVLIHIGYVALFTVIWGLLLWKPLKKYIRRPGKVTYSNLIGEMAIVASPSLGKQKKGHISWSGTTMAALLEEDASIDEVSKGTAVYVTKVSGATAIVSILSQKL